MSVRLQALIQGSKLIALCWSNQCGVTSPQLLASMNSGLGTALVCLFLRFAALEVTWLQTRADNSTGGSSLDIKQKECTYVKCNPVSEKELLLQRLLINWCQRPQARSCFQYWFISYMFPPTSERCHLLGDQPVTDTALQETQERPGARCGLCQVTLIIPASITHHNVTNHSLSRS